MCEVLSVVSQAFAQNKENAEENVALRTESRSPEPLLFEMDLSQKASDGDLMTYQALSRLPIPPPMSRAFAAQEYHKQARAAAAPAAPLWSPSASHCSGTPPSPFSSPSICTSLEREMCSNTPNSCTLDPAEDWDFLSVQDLRKLYGSVGEIIGSGVYGTVFSTLDLAQNRYIAMKVMHSLSPTTKTMLDAYENAHQEVRALLQLQEHYGAAFFAGRFPYLRDYFVAVHSDAYSLSEHEVAQLPLPHIMHHMFQLNYNDATLCCIVTDYEKGRNLGAFVDSQVSLECKAIRNVWCTDSRRKGLRRCQMQWLRYLKRRGARRMDSIGVARLLHRTLTSLYYVHRADLTHGDLTTRNLHVTKSGLPMILDFGLAVNTKRVSGQSSRWSGGDVSLAPDHGSHDRRLAAKYSHLMTHELVVGILRASDIAQLAESFMHLSKVMYAKHRFAGIRWTPRVYMAIKEMQALSGMQAKNLGDEVALHYCTKLAKAIDADLHATQRYEINASV